MRRKIYENDVRAYIQDNYNLDEKAVFTAVPESYRKQILNDTFQHFTGHKLHYRYGLKKEGSKEYFDNYISFKHLSNYQGLTFDLNYTNEQSKNLIARAKRKLHIVRKERFENRKKQKIADYNQSVYKLKWKPKNKETERRLNRLQALKKKEQSKEYER
ncbi:MAG: hypothetical protein NXI10_03570 [bacterium]|nr:hypothetical protein [bacterium]